MNHLKLFEQWAEGKLKKGNLLWPKDADMSDEDAIHRIQEVSYFARGFPVLAKVKNRSNSSGSTSWTIKEWNREKDESERGVLKYFDILSIKEFKKIVNSSKCLRDYEKDKLIKEYEKKNILNDLLKKNSWD